MADIEVQVYRLSQERVLASLTHWNAHCD